MILCQPRRHVNLGLLSLLLCAAPAFAAVRLPAIISDHMVLQRADKVPVWGWAEPDERVTVEVGRQARSARADKDGRWSVNLDLSQAPVAPTTVSVRGASNSIVVSDVLVGDVWLASGQSNMEKPVGEQRGQKPTFNAEAELAAADHPDIRLFKVAKVKARQSAADVQGQWVRCSPASLESTKFSAAAYFFGRRLQQELRVPVGLVDTTWGGTRIEPWTPPQDASLPQQGGKADGKVANTDASVIFNGMVSGLAPFAIKGAIWYQGESNVMDTDDGAAYAGKMEALVSGWRRYWQSDFPFYYVQIAPHLYHIVRHSRVLDPYAAPRLWEAQAQALRIPGTGMIVTTDLVDDLKDIHPRDKKSVGLRLANLALAGTYGKKEIEPYGPVFRNLVVDGAKAVLEFDHGQGLAARDGKALTWFDIAGEDGRYYPATAVIEGGKVVVSSPEVKKPATVRFAWDEAAEPNLVNQAGLPAMPFRSDHPIPVAGKSNE
jgi:sialate O-acetylesterase